MKTRNQLHLEIVENLDLTAINEIKRIDQSVWGIGGINEWVISPFILHGLTIKAIINGGTVGIAILFRDFKIPGLMFLFDFIILPKFQNKGYGKTFFKKIIFFLSENKIEKLGLTVDKNNNSALNIYEKLSGMKVKKEYKNIYGKGINRIYLEEKVSEILSNFI